MKRYEYVTVHVGKGILGSKLEEHRQIIDEHAAEGWRYAGYVPTFLDSNGKLYEIDLIFERDSE